MKKSIICLMGPTSSGKTELALKLVKQLPCDIISVDSAMIYRGMDIGTAKPTSLELAIAPHRLINICDPRESYGVAQFREDALAAINESLQQQRIPLLVGGTMMYFHVLQQGISSLPKASQELRARLLSQAEQFGWHTLHQRLQDVDPTAAKRIHPNDPQRLQRALEVYELTGKPLSQWFAESKLPQADYDFVNIALAPAERTLLHERIAKRFELMLQQGLIAEVEALYQRGDLSADLPALRAVGYRQVWDHLAGKHTYEEMVSLATIATRQLAKRQLTWLRSWVNIEWCDSTLAQTEHKVLSLINS